MEFLHRMGYQGGPRATFQQDYRCYSVASKGRPELERGDKIILPESAVRALTRLNVQYPMLFQLTNRQTGRKTHCSVLEFSAQEGLCFLPLWMMEQLGLYDGAIINVQNVSLKKITYVRIQPHKTAFTEISNPKAVLEHQLRNFSCLTTGDTFCIEYNAEKFYIDVLEVRPDGKACIIEADVEVDFAEPKDYKKVFPPTKRPNLDAEAKAKPRANAEPVADSTAQSSTGGGAKGATKEKDVAAAEIKHFKSAAYRLDGKPASSAAVSDPKPKPKSAKVLREEAEQKAAYQKRFDEARKAIAQRRAIRFGAKAGQGKPINKHQMFGGVAHSLSS